MLVFTIDQYDNENLILMSERGIANTTFEQYREFCKGFKERKWVNNYDITGWKVPLNQETLQHIEAHYIENQDFKYTSAAKLMMTYQKVSLAVQDKKASARWDYIFDGKDTDFKYPSVIQPMMHQRVAVQAMYNAEYFGLLMEMGTGKTKCICDELDTYARNLKADEIFKAIVVCPKSLRVNWQRELDKNLCGMHNYEVVILDGLLNSMEILLNLIRSPSKLKIVICSYDSVRGMVEGLLCFQADYLCLDESHYIKNSESKRFKALRPLSKLIPRRRILTGTPVANNILDLWSQFEILRPGCLGFNSFTGFKREFCDIQRITSGSKEIDKITGFRNLDKLKENMARVSFIVKKSRCLDLPDKLYDIHAVEMPEQLAQMYAEFEMNFRMALDDSTTMSTEVIVVQMLKLRQMCCGFAVGEEYKPGMEETERVVRALPEGDLKMREMLEDVEEVINESKLIIWCSFHYDIDNIVARLRAMGIGAVAFDGRVPDKQRQPIVDAFNNDPRTRVFVAQPAAGGVGLTLLGDQNSDVDKCKAAFFYSNGWSLGQREQAEDRCHRIGQRDKVLYRDYVYQNTIEETVALALQQKKEVANYMKDVNSIREVFRHG